LLTLVVFGLFENLRYFYKNKKAILESRYLDGYKDLFYLL